ncbi:MAG: sugar nucleotidyltransferase [Deltaproteobacteria bacterium]|nr:sugar nucleotidyltransferase [Deltaproteobacteria bacterium]
MKGVVLAGGEGSRLRRLTGGRNKHLLPVGGVPMIVRAARKLAQAGMGEILVVTGPGHVDSMRQALGTGAARESRIAFRVQDEPRGIGHALALAEDFADTDGVVVLLGDNVFDEDLAPHVAAFRRRGRGAQVFLSEVDHPEQYGVAVLDGERIARVVEKPERPPSRLAVTGIYAYDRRFADLIRSITPGPRGELEITDLNNRYAEQGELGWTLLEGFWTDAGTEEGYVRANAHAWEPPVT